MAAATTVNEFLSFVRKSAIIDEDELRAALQRCTPQEKAGQPVELAKALIREGVLSKFQAQQFLLGKTRGFLIGKHYKVLERIGTGGMGFVYLCEHQLMNRRVAIKVLPNASANDAECLKRFYREARVGVALVHPNIVRAFDVDQDEKHHYQVMEFVEGSLLQDIVDRHGPVDIHHAAHYISQTAIGLQHAHENRLVHRDIKPNNLILDRDGTVKILDMGLARIFAENEEVLTQGILGTPDYLAPEQSRDSHHVDIRADIYSLGGTMYFLLTGRTPFPDGSVAQKLLSHQRAYPTPIRQINPAVPEDLAALVEMMMAKDPDHRFQEPIEIVDALTPWTEVPIPPPNDEDMPKLSPAARRAAATLTNAPVAGPQTGRNFTSQEPPTHLVDSPPARQMPQPREPVNIPTTPPVRTIPPRRPVSVEQTPAPIGSVPVPPRVKKGPSPAQLQAIRPGDPREQKARPRRSLAWLRKVLIGIIVLVLAVGLGLGLSILIFDNPPFPLPW